MRVKQIALRHLRGPEAVACPRCGCMPDIAGRASGVTVECPKDCVSPFWADNLKDAVGLWNEYAIYQTKRYSSIKV